MCARAWGYVIVRMHTHILNNKDTRDVISVFSIHIYQSNLFYEYYNLY